MNSPLRPLGALTTAVVAAIAVDLVVTAVDAVFWTSEGGVVVGEQGESAWPAETGVTDLLLTGVQSVSLLAFTVAAVLFLVWLWRARANAEIISDGGHRWGRPWLFAGWIVPIMYLWVPKQVVDDVWTAGDLADRRSPLVTGWWACWLAGMALGVLQVVQASDSSGGLTVYALDAVSHLAAGALLIVIVRRVARDQEAHARRLAAMTAL